MALSFSVKPSAKKWEEKKQYKLTCTLYSTTKPWNKTQMTLACTSAIKFISYRIVSGPFLPVRSATNNGQNANTSAGANQPLNFAIEFAGAPWVGEPVVVEITATGLTSIYGPANIVCAGKVESDGNVLPETKNTKVEISLTNDAGIAGPPDIPKKLKAVPAGAVAIELTWKKVNQAAEIEIQRDTTNAFSAPVSWTIGGDEKKYLDLNNDESPILSPSTQYFYRIRASNNLLPDGTEFSNTDSATTTANPAAPAAPTDVKAVTPKGPGEIKVTWKGIKKLTVQTTEGKAVLTPTYQVSYSTVSGGPYTAFGTYSEKDSVTVNNLTPNTTYYFVVKSSYLESPGVASANSSQASAKTRNVPGLPLVVTGLSATAQNFVDVVIDWNDTNNATANYKIYRSTASGGPFSEIATVTEGLSTYLDVGRLENTTYYYQVVGVNSVGPGPSAQTSVLTGDAPDPPAIPIMNLVSALSDSQISIEWELDLVLDAAKTSRILRGTAMGGPYTQIAEIPVTTGSVLYSYTDTNLTQSTTFYYVVRTWNQGGESANSSEMSATTAARSVTILTQSGFSADPNARCMVKQIGGRAVYASDLDRQVVWIGGCWFKAGLKPHLVAPTVTKTTGGALEAGTYRIQTKLLRSRGKTRSEFSPVTSVVIDDANNRLRIAPQFAGTSPQTVKCRDTGFDITGTSIPGADLVEIYIASSESLNSVLLTTVAINDPIWDSPGYYQAPADLNQAMLFNNNRRTMEKLGECSLPPACSVIVPFGPRMYAFGETNIGPTSAQTVAGASISLAAGAKTFTVSNYTLPEASIYHELWINSAPTGWFVYDTEGTTGYIRNADPTKDAAGWEGIGGSFPNFFFGATPSRMYSSAFYSGEAGGLPTFSPETYPPLCTFDRELFPDDNTDPIAAIVINDSLLIGKPSKWVLARGGSNLGFPDLQFESISTGSGINSPRTLVKDSQDRAYYLGDTGPFRVTPAGVEKINVFTGNQRLFEQVFDIASVPEANMSWFSREDWLVCSGLDLIGNSGRKDGFTLDLKNNVLIPFSLPMRITWMEEVKNLEGTYQIDFGDENGRAGNLFRSGLSTDGIDFSLPNPSAFSVPISAYIKSAIIDTDNRVGIRSFQARSDVTGGPVDCRFSVIRKDRMDDQDSEQIVESISFDTDDKRNRFSLPNHSFPNAIVRMDFTMPTNPSDTRFEFRDVTMEVVRRGPIQRV